MTEPLPTKAKPPFRIVESGGVFLLNDAQGVNFIRTGCGLYRAFDTAEDARVYAERRRLALAV